jgi:hypothetical protein
MPLSKVQSSIGGPALLGVPHLPDYTKIGVRVLRYEVCMLPHDTVQADGSHSQILIEAHASGAVTSGRHLGLVGLACIASTLVFVDGPLLQKSTTIVDAEIDAPPVPLYAVKQETWPAYFGEG